MKKYCLKTKDNWGASRQDLSVNWDKGTVFWKLQAKGFKKSENDDPTEVALNEVLKNTVTMAKIHLEKNKINNVLPIMYLMKKKKLNEIEKLTNNLSINREDFINLFLNEVFESSYDLNLQEVLLKVSFDQKIPLEKVKTYLNEENILFLKELGQNETK